MNVLPRLIACDIDGTLLTGGATAVSLRLFPLIRRLQKRGVLFCPASGRQYHSLRGLFAPVADELYYLCENGGILFGPGPEDAPPVLSKTVIPRTDVPMLDAVGRPFIMSGAAPALLARYPMHCDDVAALLARLMEEAGA